MQLDQLLSEIPQFKQIESHLKTNSRQLITGIGGSARTLLINNLLKKTNRPVIMVVDTLFHADQLVSDFSNLLPDDQIFEFPVEEMGAAELATSSPEYKAQRVLAMNKLLSGEPAVVVTSVSGLKRLLPSPDQFAEAKLTIDMDSEYDLEKLKLKLHQMGYTFQKMVAAPGDFSIRGSILDIFPLNSQDPVRIDFFDTEVDSMRVFDVSNQRSTGTIKSVQVLPATDLLINDEQRQSAVENLKKQLAAEKADLDDQTAKKLTNTIEPQLMDLKNGLNDPRWLLFANLFYDRAYSLLDYLSSAGLVVFDDYSRITESQRQLESDDSVWLTDKIKNHELLKATDYTNDFKTIFKKNQRATLILSLFQKGLGRMRLDSVINITVRPMQQFFSQMPMLRTEIGRWQKQNQTVVILVQDQNRMQKVAQTLADFEIAAVQTDPSTILTRQVQLVHGNLENGFELPAADLVVITEKEMFGTIVKKRPRQTTFNNAERIKSYTDLKPGDYVVHVNHGIGRYEGMKTMTVDGKHQDYLTIAYQDSAKLFIPVTQLNMIQKYVSSEDKKPRINKLGGSDWQKTKRKVAAKIEDIADDLIALYAKRDAEKGYAYPPDDSLQNEFEARFPYTETPDQLRSADEIKHDMETAKPMDRLLVGDVGYGKTEVALRAAFKAVEVGKQVAFLVPTTILAQQHYETMLERFNDYPIEVRVLSRFQTAAQIRETLAGLKNGTVDIVVGTHRLLSKDVKFNNLGLLIIDEEQRFGVKHKERIKEMRTDVDVLTLTATPIPRTLNMSMMGVRDLSVIETPPANRYPIQTYVLEQNAGTIREAIEREMARGGQVFYLHNRVADIEKTVEQLSALVPDARIAYIHGQMTENQMEDILYDFVNGEYDVLVTTTIIETGVDIPNVNTLFVENADHMGLSQLYQLRGRIGRSSRVAYAYFMYQPNKVLTEVGEKRLEAIRDFTELGSGFKIAMRDLSIRGAGNLLGKQQSGFVDSVGYDLYTQMLADAVSKKRGKNVAFKTDTTIELDLEAYLPSDYIQDNQQKIEIYKRIRQVGNKDQLDEVTDDLLDRFGDYNQPVANLLKITEMKMYSDLAMVEKIHQDGPRVTLTFAKQASDTFGSKDLLAAIAQTKFRATINNADKKYQVILTVQPNMKDWLDQIIAFNRALALTRKKHESRKVTSNDK
ncbi:transcription-repair coupling factor [Lentilactobacillus farraginis]|uniref:Transcription-repair-coupling factor n=1 Tax=Lentilactobacillus farraginis DSM 18382 = JCM 14108 TaxID=1423743 RepID=X0PIK2_9LACO|nr:transcription-repair coupling factor [Lentilactobacillus farraginis]KRM09623.1 transcription-repair coupling factor [Lentilactobacillus farraginis DSM 18382 = JCM 14108]GAF36376.1 transcription-repair coupling factor [Lentilactobacillus farraginis DSM 18382 = JCM 14108]